MAIGRRLMARGQGSRVSQTNPAEGAKSLGQWVTAVLSMKGESDVMPADAAVDMIHATPASARSRFAKEIWRRRRQNPGELVIMAANPGPTPSESRAADLYQRFHGRGAQHVDEYHEPTPRPATLTELGDLLELRVERINGWKWGSLDMGGRGIKVSSNAGGTQIYFIGGQQRLSKGDFTRLGADRSKELIDLGTCRYIAYRAKKEQVNGVSSGYEHFLGEETKVYPRLQYDRRGPEPRLLLAGGAYHIEAAGIVN